MTHGVGPGTGGVNGSVVLVDSVPAAFADLVATELTSVPDGFSLVLSGGGTAVECYAALAARPGLPWDRVDVLLGDERCVPPDDPDSNHRMVTATLLDTVGPVRSDHPMYTGGDPAAAAAAYQAVVESVGRPDLIHLGLGPDGHTASLFPGSAAVDDTDGTHLVVVNTDPNGVNPHVRLTLTFAAIARARTAVVTVAGAAKRDALARIAAGEDLPGGRLTADDLVWLVDADALGDLTPDRVA